MIDKVMIDRDRDRYNAMRLVSALIRNVVDEHDFITLANLLNYELSQLKVDLASLDNLYYELFSYDKFIPDPAPDPDEEDDDFLYDHTYEDDFGNTITETLDGHIFVNGSCVQEPGSDADFDRYAVEVQNGNGFYDSNGKFVRYSD